ncbi:MAG: 30S ribosomal protein S6 [Simkaniaceae bacterium]|nr:30S ribosomal protein S6 [Simkaniaceae bacterium]
MSNKQELYEGIYIINATLSEEASKKALERITSAIESRDGVVKKIHEQGRKKLAYEILGSKQGYFFVIFFTIAPAMIAELWKDYHLNEDLVRFMTLRTDVVQETLEFKSLA